ncbi:MAG: hypothetical protein IJE93_10600 [Clostridia bacterium]|nr:hypothetical protein [Clostridia bacterium]
MVGKNKVYVLGLVISSLVILSDVVYMIMLSDFSIFSVIAILATFLGFIYCIKSKKIWIIASFILEILLYLHTIFSYRNILLNDEDSFYMSLEDIRKLCFNNFLTTFFLAILPLVLIGVGLLIKNKKYNILATIAIILIYTITIVLSFRNIYYYGVSAYIVLTIISIILHTIYILVIWYKIGLSDFVNYKPLKTESSLNVKKEMVSAEVSLESLKVSFENGEIGEEEYNSKKAEIISSL